MNSLTKVLHKKIFGRNYTTVSIKGERGTGTRFLRKILNYYFNMNWENINHSIYDADGYYGWKHGYIFDDEVKKINNDKAIVCIINKDIYAWLLSMFHHAHELKSVLPSPPKTNTLEKEKAFLAFIDPENKVYDNYESWIKEFYKREGIYDQYDSLYDLRYKKYRSMFNDEIDRKIYIKYEDLLTDHFSIVKIISEQFGLKITKKMNPDFNNYKRRGFYLNKEFMNSFTPLMIDTVRQNIDLPLEQEMGYFL